MSEKTKALAGKVKALATSLPRLQRESDDAAAALKSEIVGQIDSGAQDVKEASRRQAAAGLAALYVQQAEQLLSALRSDLDAAVSSDMDAEAKELRAQLAGQDKAEQELVISVAGLCGQIVGRFNRVRGKGTIAEQELRAFSLQLLELAVPSFAPWHGAALMGKGQSDNCAREACVEAYLSGVASGEKTSPPIGADRRELQAKLHAAGADSPDSRHLVLRQRVSELIGDADAGSPNSAGAPSSPGSLRNAG